MKSGLRMGRDKAIEITKRYLLKPHILLLMLTNQKRGAPFLQAVLSVLNNYYSDRVANDVALVNDAEGDWSRYIYDDKADRPQDKNEWYNILTKSEKISTI